MEKMWKKYLLGINKKENRIYFGKFETRDWNGYFEFSASFDIGEAFDIEAFEEEKNVYKNNYWDCLDAESKIACLNDGEITKDQYFEDWEITDFKDCSCTDYETTLKNGQTINFETISCGQCDIRENKEEFENIIFTNKKAVLLLLDLWDDYHLKNIENNIKEIEKKINIILESLKEYERYEHKNIENFIKKYIEEV